MNVATGLALIIAGVVIFWSARKAASGSLERNWAMGLRTRKLMASDEAWEIGHRAAAPTLMWAAATSVLAGAAVVPQKDDGAAGTIITLGGAFVLLTLVLLSVRRAHRALEPPSKP